ncbi:hypothetical protein C1X65_06450 [Pseudomonas sp. FW305-70]|nr:hypothetical protein C1X65_06450 [Pseudomonas sp. FW305-70]
MDLCLTRIPCGSGLARECYGPFNIIPAPCTHLGHPRPQRPFTVRANQFFHHSHPQISSFS